MAKDNFVNLHVHSTYSFVDGYGLPDSYAKRAAEIGQPALACTDHGNISSHYKWYKECKKVGVKPILGVEFYIVENKDELRIRDYNHITVFAKNNVGYRNLTKLVTKSWCEQFYYKPRITVQDLMENKEGLVVLSGCLSSLFMNEIKDGHLKECEEKLIKFKEVFGSDFYAEIVPIGWESGKVVYDKFLEIVDRLKLPIVVTSDCHYVCKHHHEIQEVMLCIQSKDVMKNPERWKFDSNDFYLKSRQEMTDALKAIWPERDFTEALDNTVKIAEQVDFTFPTATPISFPMEESEKVPFLTKKCFEGLKEKNIDTEQYRNRLEYEIDLIVKKNFIDYFLVISDLVNWAKSQEILVGPARGSAAGSLACFALHITEIDPIKYDLIFERFIDINREDLPDIDIDFQDDRRNEIKTYLEGKYGQNRVGTLPTFAYFKGKSTIADIGRVFQIPFKVVEKVKSLIIERSGGDSRASFTIMDTFESDVFTYPKEAIAQYPEFKFAGELEGQIRQMGQHAAGVVISNQPLTDFCAIYLVKGNHVMSIDYKDATDIGLLKIDVLGLNTLSVLDKTNKLIVERGGKKIDFYKLPLTDKKTYKGFLDEKLFGIFQFDGQAVNQVCRQIKPKDFSALYDISALARPGPLNSGSATLYIERRAGRKPVEHIHPLMANFTKDTQGIIIYQEQVMQAMRQIGKMSWKDTAEIRKAISKSQGLEAFNRYKANFSVGAKENGLTENEIDTIWDSVCTFGSWAFNKSHSVSYSAISYWTMYLKVHHPIEFYTAILSLNNMDDKKKKIIKEAKREGIKILPVDLNKSKESFSIDEEGIRIGFGDVNGIGESSSKKLIKHQPYKTFQDFILKAKPKKNILSKFASLGILDKLESNYEHDLFGNVVVEYEKKDLSFQERFKLCPWDMDFGIEKNWRGFIMDSEFFVTKPISIEELKEDSTGEEEVAIMGIAYDKNLRDLREVTQSRGQSIGDIRDPHLTQFCNFILEDDTDFITVRLSRWVFPQYAKMLFEEIKDDDVIILKGRMGTGIRMFFANKMLILRKIKEKLNK